MTRNQFLSRKKEILEKVLPFLINGTGVAGLSVGECALLMSPDENHIMPKAAFTKTEKSALFMLNTKLRSMGINRSADLGLARQNAV